MRRFTLLALAAAVGVVALAFAGTAASSASAKTTSSCSRGSKAAVIAGNFKCLRVSQRCSMRYQGSYRKYRFHCANGRLRRGTGLSATPAQPPVTPPPPPAPTPAAIDGHYKGVTSQNETFEFDIVNGGLSFRGLKTGQINQGCTPQFHIYGNYFNWPDYSVSVSRSGDFTIDTDRSGAHVGQSPGTTHLTIRWHVTGSTASGSLELNTSFRDIATSVPYACGSGLQTWTVTRTG
jgi:hypothetical protein